MSYRNHSTLIRDLRSRYNPKFGGMDFLNVCIESSRSSRVLDPFATKVYWMLQDLSKYTYALDDYNQIKDIEDFSKSSAYIKIKFSDFGRMNRSSISGVTRQILGFRRRSMWYEI